MNCLDLRQLPVTDPFVVCAAYDVVTENPKAVKDGAINALMGRFHKITRGRVDPENGLALVREAIEMTRRYGIGVTI
jgi:Asp-tRNA(Asn)/Glu-tRNA(Gln) amidotransferase B subunit